jgi:hypothetical protein
VMSERLGDVRLAQLRALIEFTEPGTIRLPGNTSLMIMGAPFKEPWIAISASELTILLDELGVLRSEPEKP